jgi:hypothetical protein
LPFKCNLQRYIEGLTAQLSPTVRLYKLNSVDP